MIGQLASYWPLIAAIVALAIVVACNQAKSAGRRIPWLWSLIVASAVAIVLIGLRSEANRRSGPRNPGGFDISLNEILFFLTWLAAIAVLVLAAILAPKARSQVARWFVRGAVLLPLVLTAWAHRVDANVRRESRQQEIQYQDWLYEFNVAAPFNPAAGPKTLGHWRQLGAVTGQYVSPDFTPGDGRIRPDYVPYSLEFRGPPAAPLFNKDVFQWLQFAPSVRSLRFESIQISDANMQKLAQLAGIEELRLHSCGFSASGLAALAELPRLEKLDLGGSHLQQNHLELLTTFPALKMLDLAGTGLNVEDVKWLEAQTTLRRHGGDMRLAHSSSAGPNRPRRTPRSADQPVENAK